MTAATTQLPQVGTYRLDPQATRIAATTRAMFGLLPIRATFALEAGQLDVADPITDSTATATIDAASFASGNAKRDHHIASADFLDAENHPTIAFTATGISAAGDGWTIRGDLTVRGVRRPVELAVTDVQPRADGLTLTAATTVDRYAHGVSKAKGMAGGSIHLEITAVATRS